MKRILSMFLILCCVVSVFSGAAAESSAAAMVGLSSDPYSFQMLVNGQLYTLPMTYESFTAMGWVYQGDSSAAMDSGYYSSTEVFKLGDLRCYAAIVNFDNSALPVSRCYIGGIAFDEYDVKKAADFTLTLPGGLSYGTATAADAQALYGTPTRTYEASTYTKLTYKYASYCDLDLDFSTETGLLNGVEMRHVEAPADFVATEVSAEVPAIVTAYTSPSAVSNSLADFTASYGGVVYQLPVPVSVMLDNGWKIVEKDSVSVISGRSFGWVTLMLDNQRLRMKAQNYSGSAAPAANCFVTEFKCDDYDCVVELIVAKGITVGMSETDLIAALQGENAEKTKSSSFVCYEVTPGARSLDHYKIYVKDGAVYKLNMSYSPKYADYTAGK